MDECKVEVGTKSWDEKSVKGDALIKGESNWTLNSWIAHAVYS